MNAVLVRVSSALVKYCDQMQVGEEGFISGYTNKE